MFLCVPSLAPHSLTVYHCDPGKTGLQSINVIFYTVCVCLVLFDPHNGYAKDESCGDLLHVLANNGLVIGPARLISSRTTVIGD